MKHLLDNTLNWRECKPELNYYGDKVYATYDELYKAFGPSNADEPDVSFHAWGFTEQQVLLEEFSSPHHYRPPVLADATSILLYDFSPEHTVGVRPVDPMDQRNTVRKWRIAAQSRAASKRFTQMLLTHLESYLALT